MVAERVLSNLNLISFKTEGGLQNHIDELQDGDLVFTPDNSLKGNLFDFKWTDHTLNDMSWLNADTFSWQSGDVYVAAYEHLVADFVAVENESKKYIYCKQARANGDLVDDDKKYYRVPEYDSLSTVEGYSIAWRPNSDSTMVVVTNTETPVESDFVYYIEPMDGLSLMNGRVREAGADGWEKETIDGITVYYIVAPDGHKICVPDQEANVQAIYEATGVAWYYILDTENKQFKLPRTKHAFTGLRDSVGKYVPAGVPDIAGRAEVVGYTTTVGGAWSTGGSMSGSMWTRKTSGAVSESGYWFDGQLRFTASRSNSIYGNSNTVQPPATQMYLYFYVGNFERDALEQTAGITSEQLNNKADLEIFNAIYPVGSIYIGTQTTCPMAIAIKGSTWELLEAGRALWTGNGSNGNTKIAAGLPNITGAFSNTTLLYAGQDASGAFSKSEHSGKYAQSVGSSAGTNVNFNASRSSSIYGNSNTVQPPAYVVNVWRRTA